MDMEPRELVQAIKAKGLTQKQIEEKTGIPQPTVSKIARGDVSDVMSKSYRALVSLHAEVCGPVEVAPAPATPVIAEGQGV